MSIDRVFDSERIYGLWMFLVGLVVGTFAHIHHWYEFVVIVAGACVGQLIGGHIMPPRRKANR